MLYKTHHLTRIIIHWDEEKEESQASAFEQWLDDNRIYPVRGGNGGSWNKNVYHYNAEDAIRIEAYLKEVGRKCQILRS